MRTGPALDADVIEGRARRADPQLAEWEVGHTVGSLAVFFPRARPDRRRRIASYEGEPILGVFNVDLAQARPSFARPAQLDADIACYGHGAPIVGDAQAKLRRVAAAFG